MKINILNCFALGSMLLLAAACNDSVSDLLESKVYFEMKETTVKVQDDASTVQLDLAARISSLASTEVDVTYSIADKSAVDEYNTRFGTNYEMFDVANVKLSQTSSSVPSGSVYATAVKIELSKLDVMEEGQSFVLPIKVQSASLPTIEATSIAYYFITKPIKIVNAGDFNVMRDGGCIDLKNNPAAGAGFPAGAIYDSFTYEALVYINQFGGNMTVMGTEGHMILRIGDQPGGITPKNELEVAGHIAYGVKEPLNTGRWYHLALTYDKAAGQSCIYINGELKASTQITILGFEPNKDKDLGFKIGKLNGFQWGERPFLGKMAEVRVWSVARTANQIKQYMLGVDSKSDGLEVYYKLNGSEKLEDGYLYDSTGKMKGSVSWMNVVPLDTPIDIN